MKYCFYTEMGVSDLEKIWNDIQLISELNDRIQIESIDNYYIISNITWNKIDYKIKIEKNYRLTNLWSDDNEPSVYYDVSILTTDFNSKKLNLTKNDIIKIISYLITPYVRDIKLKSIGI